VFIKVLIVAFGKLRKDVAYSHVSLSSTACCTPFVN
jgi:hypothetical protein